MLTSYRRLQVAVTGAVTLALAVGLALGFTSQRDVFPFFSWSLFTNIPNVRVDFAVLIVQLDNRVLDPAPDLLALDAISSASGKIRAYYTIQDLGLAVSRRQTEEIDRIRRLFEDEYLAGFSGDLRYRLIARSYDPVEKWRHGTFHQQPLAELVRRKP